MLAYGQSKTANVLFAVEATRRWAADGVTANALMPGVIWTDLQRHWDPAVLARTKAMVADAGMQAKAPEQGRGHFGAAGHLAGARGDRRALLRGLSRGAGLHGIVDGVHGVRDYPLDPESAERLWEVSLELLAAARGGG